MSPVEPVEERLYMLVLVLSAPANFKQREQTRAQNWAPHNLRRGKIQIIFLLGRVKDQHLQASSMLAFLPFWGHTIELYI